MRRKEYFAVSWCCIFSRPAYDLLQDNSVAYSFFTLVFVRSAGPEIRIYHYSHSLCMHSTPFPFTSNIPGNISGAAVFRTDHIGLTSTSSPDLQLLCFRSMQCLKIYILQSSVVTLFRCGDVCNNLYCRFPAECNSERIFGKWS